MVKLGKLHPLVSSIIKNCCINCNNNKNYTNCNSCNNINNKNYTNCKPCKNNFGFNLCNQPYALCTSAKCELIKGTENDSIPKYKCYCDVEIGCSMGTKSCNDLKPYKKDGKYFIYSTFNPKQLKENYKLTYCNNGNLINCLNKICYIDPYNHKKSYCFCNLQPFTGLNNNWVTMSKKNKKCSCNNLSGAITSSFNDTVIFWKQCKNINILNLN